MLPKSLSELKEYMNKGSNSRSEASQVLPITDGHVETSDFQDIQTIKVEPIEKDKFQFTMPDEKQGKSESVVPSGKKTAESVTPMNCIFSSEFDKLLEWKKRIDRKLEETYSELDRLTEEETEGTENLKSAEFENEEKFAANSQKRVFLLRIEGQIQEKTHAINRLIQDISKERENYDKLDAEYRTKMELLADMNKRGGKASTWDKELKENLAEVEIEKQKLRRKKEELEALRNAQVEKILKQEEEIKNRIERSEEKIKQMPERNTQERIIKKRLIAKLKQAYLKLKQAKS
ncbi:DNA ligase 1-like [Artemia franciscana]|uniref:Uncharacterized protein n=1 Tax=Artemia franciscana TaxID=6661 RepID=A0AA88HZN0_ARTSF|nr:hypothetical protein QYM36_009533 [Artemia franciscana]